MRRREFISVLAGSAAWALAAHAQQAERARRVGVLVPFAVNDTDAQARNAVFVQSLRELGWTIGRDLQIDYRWPGGDAASIRRDDRGGAGVLYRVRTGPLSLEAAAKVCSVVRAAGKICVLTNG